MKRSHKKNRNQRSRRAAATVEAAMCLPVLLVIIFGTIECCNAIYMRQSLEIAAYEAARAAVLPKTTDAQAENRATNIVNARNIKGATVVTVPADIAKAKFGDFIKITVQAPVSQNSIIGGFLKQTTHIVGEVEMMKEA